jgi:Flp pilus assembly protein TadD
MISKLFKLTTIIAITTAGLAPALWAGNVKITIPMRSSFSPVQRLNREGVEAVKKHQFQKAEQLFYKAYLYDPTDPFTLNNLGFIAEQQGQLDRAHKFYELATEQSCNAQIALSSAKDLEKKPMTAALEGLQDLPMRINRMNVEAMRLLSQDRVFEAVALLQQAIALDPRNPFTMNNLGVADEAAGNYNDALKNYEAASAAHSTESVLVTFDRSWAGKPVSAMAAASATRLEKRLSDRTSAQNQAVMLNLRGVLAANQNDLQGAMEDFARAYSLDPNNAFSLNNRGYIAEREGDLESAQFFYEKAQRAGNANDRVGFATKRLAEGKALSDVASDSDRKVDGALDAYSQQRHQQTGSVELTPRANGMSQDTTPTAPEQAVPQSPTAAPSPSTQPAPQ